MDEKKIRCTVVNLTLSIFIVLVLLVVGMLLYPGGHHGVVTGYSISRHVVSDLGRTYLSNGTPNTLCSVLFALAMIIVGQACLNFWVTRHTLISHRQPRIVVIWAGIAMSLGMAAIGITPLNHVKHLHDAITAVTGIGFALAAGGIAFCSGDMLEEKQQKYGWLIGLAFISIIWTCLVGLHKFRVISFRPWLPIGQKCIIFAFIVWMGYQTYLMWQLLRKQERIIVECEKS